MSFKALVLQPLLREQARLEKPRVQGSNLRYDPTCGADEQFEDRDQQTPDWEREAPDLGALNRRLRSLPDEDWSEAALAEEGLLTACEQREWWESLAALKQGLGEEAPRRLALREWLDQVA